MNVNDNYILASLGPPNLLNVSSFLMCDSDDKNRVTLLWTPPNSTNTVDVMTHYELAGLPQSVTCSPGPCDMIDSTHTSITGLQCNTSYSVSVRAVSGCGVNGTFSDPIEIFFHPKPIVTSTSVSSSTIGRFAKTL